MDYMMPIMNGPEATFGIREVGYTKPIIGITGNALSNDIEYFKSKGANEVILKPFNVLEMNKVLDKIRNE